MNCGQQIPDGARFCANCGTATGAIKSEGTQREAVYDGNIHNAVGNSKRTSVYDGEIHKCPNCGEVLNSFTSTCPACGFELRGTKSSHSVTTFAEKLEKAISEEQRASLIRNFPVPNTKEDILEFMILASSNFETKLDIAIADAWLSKIEQCYQKGKLLFKDDVFFVEIQNAYDQAYAKIKSLEQQKKNKTIISLALHTVGLWGGLLIFVVAFLIDVISVKTLRYTDTSVYHLGAGAMMIIGAYVVGKKFNSLPCASVGIVCGILSMILGSLLDSVFFGNGSMMMIVGGVVIVMSVVNLVKYSKK